MTALPIVIARLRQYPKQSHFCKNPLYTEIATSPVTSFSRRTSVRDYSLQSSQWLCGVQKEGSPSSEGLPCNSGYRLSFFSKLLGHAASSDNQDDNGDDQYCTNGDDSPQQVARNSLLGRSAALYSNDRCNW